MEPIDIKSLEVAVTQFYGSTSQEQAQTHSFLSKMQTSTHAWSFSWELMRLEKSQEVQFFGAVTLHAKLMKYWNEVPPESREELKHKLLEAIVAFSNGPKIVLNRLCIAFGAYIVHMIDEWPTSIEDVINTFQNQQIPNVASNMLPWILFEILQGIPDEITAIYTSVQRVTLRCAVAKRCPVVMQTAVNYLEHKVNEKWSPDDFSNMTRAVRCIGTWVKNMGYQIDNCYKICEILVKLINQCYWPCIHEGDGCMSANENELAEVSAKTIINIMIQPESHLYPKSAFALLKLYLDSLLDITKSEWKEDNNNEDIVADVYTLIISSIERHSQLLLTGIITTDQEHSELYGRVVNAVLQCTSKPGVYPVGESCSSLSMGFWYMLQDEVFAMQDNEERNKCWENIKPLYAHLTRVLIKKAQQPDESASETWSTDDYETFRCYRQDISDTWMYCYDVLHDSILDVFTSALQEAIMEMNTNPTTWTKLEACIYAFSSISEHIDTDEKRHIPKFVEVLVSIPYEKMNEKLLGTALEAVGSYCQWFRENPNYIASAIDLLVKGLNSSMSSEATLGLKDLCRDCQIQVKPYAEPLLDACQASITSGQLKNTDAVRLMFGIGKLMSTLPAAKIPVYLNIIVSPCFEELQVICQAGEKTAAAKIRTVFRLNMVSTLFASLNTDVEEDEVSASIQPVLMVMQKTMPLFKQIADLWIEHETVIETALNALKHAITNLGEDFKPMLEDLCCFIISVFHSKVCPPALEISKTCIVLFFKDETYKNLMQQLFSEMVSLSLQLVEQTPEHQLSNIAETLETFYACNVNILKKHPSAFINPNIDLNKLFLYAIKAVTLPENGPIKCGVQFLQHFIMQSRNDASMTQVVLNQCQQLVRTALLCVGLYTPRCQAEKFADIFLSLNKKYPEELGASMKILAAPNFPTPVISEADKAKFMSQIIREKTNKRLIQTYINEFAAKARGLIEKI